MTMEEIKELPPEELELRLLETYEEMYNLRFQHAMHQLDNPLRLRDVRRDIARIKTVLNEYGLGIRQSGKEQQ